MIDIMLDLETWGTTPGSDIRSIGAVVFDPLAGYTAIPCGDENNDSKSLYTACDNPIVGIASDWIGTLGFTPNPADSQYDVKHGVYRKYPLRRDPRTVQWWSEQSEEAQAAFDNPVDLREALTSLTMWVDQICDPQAVMVRPTGGWRHIRIWSHGAAFDPPILAAAYEAVGLPVPWYYRAPRDTRTLFDLVGITDHSAHLATYATGTYHHALDDAICQARAVCAAWPPSEPVALLHRHPDEMDELEHYDHSYGRLTNADKDTRWSETFLYKRNSK